MSGPSRTGQRTRWLDLHEEIESENFRRRFESLLEAMPFPATMPAYSSLLVDSEDCLWVQDYRARGEETNRWSV